MTAKTKRNELSGVEWEPHGSGGGKTFVPRVAPRLSGEYLGVYLDEETVAAMKSEGWTKVTAGFKRNADGDFEELHLKQSTDGIGLKIKGPSARDKRLQIHVHVKRHGNAVAKPNAGRCEVSRVGDAFVFKILDQVSIVPAEESSILKIAS